MRLSKFNKIFGGIILGGIGLFFLLMIILGTLSQQFATQNNTINLSKIILYVFVCLFIIIWFELCIYFLKWSIKIDDATIKYENSGFLNQLTKMGRILKTTQGIIFTIVVMIILYPLIKSKIGAITLKEGVIFSKLFFIVVGIFLLYFILRALFKNKIITLFKSIIKILLTKNGLKISVEENKLIIDLNIKNLKHPEKRFVIKIDVNEIDEIKEFNNPMEVQTYFQSELGVEVGVKQMQASIELAKYMNGTIKRPNKYFGQSSYGKLILIKGKTLFYVINIDFDSYTRLINAFNNTKRKK